MLMTALKFPSPSRAAALGTALALVMIGLGALAPAQRAPSPQEVLKRMEVTHAGVTAITGTYTQVRDDAATDDRILSVADFRMLKPSKFRAEYRRPRATTILAVDDLMYRYIPANKQVERYQFRRLERPIRQPVGNTPARAFRLPIAGRLVRFCPSRVPAICTQPHKAV
jgi:outer membrane lipoprotein-sorting protein